jgi:hypothetical protein
VAAVQELWLAGRRDEAADRVPLDLGMNTNLLGPPAMIAERLRRYQDAGVTTLEVKLSGDRTAQLDTLAQLTELAARVPGSTGQPPGGGAAGGACA